MGEKQSPPATERLQVEPLGSHHNRAAFSCGTTAMDQYFHERARKHQAQNVSRVFVLVPSSESTEVRGYYALSNSSILFEALPKDLGKGLPTKIPLPATLLGRMAIHKDYQKRGYGRMLLLHALRQVLRASDTSASLGTIIDVVDDTKVGFYKDFGFVPLSDKSRHMIIPINRMHALFSDEVARVPTGSELLQPMIAGQLARISELQISVEADPSKEDMLNILQELQGLLQHLRDEQSG